MKKNKRNRKKSGSARVEPTVLSAAKKICKNKGILISFWLTEAAKEKLVRENQAV